MTVRDIKKLVEYWLTSSNEDVKVARELLQSKRYAYALFFCHMAIEKMLKAVVVDRIRDHAPWTHNLPFLAGRANLMLDKEDTEFLVEMTRWNLEARYPSDIEGLKKIAMFATTQKLLKETETFLRWLRRQL